ncbi:hypothetical protein TIFTF001_001684 [Ficus carica]|uniref:Uncharacterized protein n=1 Tax=Ficus carica TaxID=3494 RepID=A0AA87ZI41_FICCA|nr:hypothetical protein TIFTF001_001684 [Ficus carica]
MPLQQLHIPPQSRRPVIGNHRQDRLQPRYLVDRNTNRERVPVQNITEGRDVMLGDQHGDALGEDRLGDTGAGDLVAARTEAELALVEEGGADAAVAAACEEGEGGSAGKGGAAGEGRDLAGLEVDFGEGGVFFWVEVLGGVGVAWDPD